ncbi:MAG: sodium:proline symporter, partial [Pseudomonadota bacterium]
ALAFDRSSNILSLVANAWFGFGSAFGPVILFSLFSGRMTKEGALAGMLTGAVVVLVWVYTPASFLGDFRSGLAAIIPGFTLATAAIFAVSSVTRPVSDTIAERHAEMQQRLCSH